MFQKTWKQMGAWLLALSMVVSSAQLPAMEAKAASGNLALSATATASDVESDTSLNASLAIDGRVNREAENLEQSRWASDITEGTKWLQLAWNETQTMKSFAIEWERKNPTDYSISVSDDGETWISVWSTTEAPEDYYEVVNLDEAVSGKYVRLTINSYEANCPNYNGQDINWNTVSVYEFEVYEEEIAGGDTQPDVPPVVEEQKYTIYPTPQSVVYDADESTLTLPEEVNVVFEDGIDQATKDRLSVVLSVKNITAKEVEAVEDGKVNIVIGINGSNGVAAAYAENNLTYAENLFEQRDAYLLAIEANQITIVGKDTDAAFYALASLKMILEQSEGTEVYQLQMEDYAIGQYRGFIEGYYGIPWSVEDRISLMEFGGDFKMNVYIFAPKDDPYHNTNWRSLYPEEEIANIKKMVAAGTASKCRFVWAIHPFMNQAITLDNYDDTLDIVKAKFEQLYSAGVRQFVISADDAYSNPDVQVKLLNDMSAWVKSKGDCYNLAFVPMVYCTGAGSWYGSATSLTSYYEKMQAVDADVEFMWTGEYVCHPATQYTFDHFKQISGREAFMWLNWPVNDVNHARLVMGPAENCILNTGGVTGFMGIVTNPLEQAEASKTSLFAIADYAWNTADFNCEKSWADCFQYIDAGASESLHEICKHLTNPSPGGITGMAESKEIRPYVEAFQRDYEAGNDLTESGAALIEQFEKIVDAANDFQENGTNENLKDEMEPWVNALRYISEAGLNYVKTAVAIQENDSNEAAKGYIQATVAYDASKNCAAPQLSGTIMAESGAQVLMPFAQSMSSSLKSGMTEVLKNTFGSSTAGGDAPSTEVSVFYSGLGGFYQGGTAQIIDGDETTFAWFNQPQAADAYIGVDLGDTYRINGVKILQGGAGGQAPSDIMANAILEYSTDGANYTVIETIPNTNDIVKDYSDTSILARYVRIRTADASSKWYAIREFSVTTSAATYAVYTNAEALAEIQASIDTNNAAILTEEGGSDITLKANEYIGIQLPRIREITSIAADYTANSNLVLEGSLDGSEWTELSTGDQATDLAYIRIRNKGTADVSFKLSELSLTNSDRDARFVTDVEWEEGYDPAYATDNSLATSFRAAEGSGAGSLTWRISETEKIGPVYIITNPGAATDAVVSVQTNTGEWVEKGSLNDGLTIVSDLEWYDSVKAVKIAWTDAAPEILEMYTTEPREVGITLNKDSAKVQVEGTVQLRADVFVNQNEDSTVTWTSDDPKVASVDENGLVTGVSVGSVTITASVEGGKYTATCTIVVSGRGSVEELNIVGVEAGSVEVENASSTEGPAEYAIDGSTSTFWHSLWDGDQMDNLWISVDLGDVYDVSQLKYLPRQSGGTNGIITGYKIYVSLDGEEWTLASVGTWDSNTLLKTAEIIEAVPARYVKLAATNIISDQAGNNFASAAEISVFGYQHDDAMADKRYVIDAALSTTLEASKYTEESYQAYLDAKAAAETVMNNMAATQNEIDAAAKAYRDAVANLKVKVTDVVVAPSEVTLKIGTSTELSVTIKPSDASDKNVTFTSDKPEIASVSKEGVVEAKSEGTAVITIASANGVSDTCTVYVVETFAATGVKITGAPTKALEIGDQVTVTAVVEPENADNKNVTWTSDAPAVATVEDGVVTAVSAGEANITVTTEDGGFEASFKVTVNARAVTGIKVSGVPAAALEVGSKAVVTATVEPADATNKNVIWTSSNPAVAVVENGVITAIAAGEAVITVKSENNDVQESFTITVKAKADVQDPNANKPSDTTPAPTISAGDEVETASGRYQVISAAKKTAKLVQAKNKTKASITVPAQVTINGVKCKVVQVGPNAFKGFKKLKKITLTKNITTIGKNAFSGCTKLSSVVVKGTSLKTIKTGAFKKTSAKMTVTFKSKKVTAKSRAALLKKMKKAGMSKSAKLK